MTITDIDLEITRCGAEALGILQALDQSGEIPETARSMVVDVLRRYHETMREWKRMTGRE